MSKKNIIRWSAILFAVLCILVGLLCWSMRFHHFRTELPVILAQDDTTATENLTLSLSISARRNPFTCALEIKSGSLRFGDTEFPLSHFLNPYSNVDSLIFQEADALIVLPDASRSAEKPAVFELQMQHGSDGSLLRSCLIDWRVTQAESTVPGAVSIEFTSYDVDLSELFAYLCTLRGRS